MTTPTTPPSPPARPLDLQVAALAARLDDLQEALVEMRVTSAGTSELARAADRDTAIIRADYHVLGAHLQGLRDDQADLHRVLADLAGQITDGFAAMNETLRGLSGLGERGAATE